MGTEFFTRVALAPAALWVALSAQAQLSSPVPGVAPVQKKSAPASPVSAGPAAGLPAGSGPGVHSPDSPFAPLPPRADVVPWSVLTSVTTRTDKNRVLPVFNAGQLALHQKTQRIQGFMMPLEPGEKQSHFLLSSVPLTCSFCTPGGPESMVEVKARTPVRATMEPVVVEGRFLVLNDDPYGLYYRVTEAVAVK
jgi:uncharacterized protein